AQGIAGRAAVRVADSDVVQACRPRWRRRAVARLPGVQPEVMVIAAGGDERRLVAVPLHDVEAQDVPVEAQRLVDVRDLEVDVADVDALIDAHARGRYRAGSRFLVLAGRERPKPPALRVDLESLRA